MVLSPHLTRSRIACLLSALAIIGSAQSVAVRWTSIPASQSGISWRHENGKSADRHLPETVGAGVAIFDYDGDGWMDIFFVNSGPADFYKPPIALRHALYRNNHDGTFRDVTARAGLTGTGGFGMGAAAADYDGDGHTDLLVTQYGENRLFRNNGDGTFADVTRTAGIAGQGWWTSAVWFDYDRDGKLDLFIANYVDYRKDLVKLCFDMNLKVSAYCVPRMFSPTASRLYHNEGNGTFQDVSQATGIATYAGKAFGAVATDINGDGWADLFVASDMAPNALFLNHEGRRFEDIGLASGVAYSEAGEPRSGMGVDAVDYDGDGRQDLFVANIDQQYFALYRNRGDLQFTEEPGQVRRDTRLLSGWGLKFFDMDNDGDADLLLANGHPDDMIARRMPSVTYAEPLLLFENREGTFINVSAAAGPVFQQRWNARGLAIGDLDNDGDSDVVIGINGGAPLVLRNETGNRRNWVGIRLRPRRSNPAAEGAVIQWTTAHGTWRRLRTGGGSFLSSHDSRELLGLGQDSSARIEVKWPTGQVTRQDAVKAGQYVEIAEPLP
ncbi:MAG: CRTAC1 family protein [Acidobacteria bacterium]|nr:CRTAC1 family protein [Acidobacteriota bacterium]